MREELIPFVLQGAQLILSAVVPFAITKMNAIHKKLVAIESIYDDFVKARDDISDEIAGAIGIHESRHHSERASVGPRGLHRRMKKRSSNGEIYCK